MTIVWNNYYMTLHIAALVIAATAAVCECAASDPSRGVAFIGMIFDGVTCGLTTSRICRISIKTLAMNLTINKEWADFARVKHVMGNDKPHIRVTHHGTEDGHPHEVALPSIPQLTNMSSRIPVNLKLQRIERTYGERGIARRLDYGMARTFEARRRLRRSKKH